MVQALMLSHADLDLRHFQLASVLGRVVPLHALFEANCLLPRERLIQRGGRVHV